MKRKCLFICICLLLARMLSAQCLSGTYTLGSGGDLSTFAEAVQRLNTDGVCGEVVIEILPGTYCADINLVNVQGLSIDKSLTFISKLHDASSVKLTYCNVGGGNFTLEQSPFIRIRHLTLETTSSNHTIRAFNSRGVRVDSCLLLGDVYFVGEESDDFSFSNNQMPWSYFYALTGGVGAISGGNIEKNHIGGTVWCEDANEVQLLGNRILGGLTLNNCISPNVRNNHIQSVVQRLLKIWTVQDGDFINNAMFANSNTTNLVAEIGACKGCQFVHNVFRMEGNQGGLVYAYSNGDTTPIYFYNNIFYNKKGPIITKELTQEMTSDYNAFYTEFSQFGDNQISTYTTLAEWVAATGNDAHSIFASPNFFSPDDFHIANDPNLANMGLPLPTLVTDDFDGESRDATPDIGADEFTGMSHDVGVVFVDKMQQPTCHGHPEVFIKIKNFGSDTLRHAPIRWTVNGTAQPTYFWEGQLAPGDTSGLFSFGNAPFWHEENTLQIWSDLASDTQHQNDSILLNNLVVRMGGEYSVGMVGADFGSLSEAAASLQQLGVCDSVRLVIMDESLWESPVFDSIPGASAEHHVVVESVSGNPNTCLIRNFISSPNQSSFTVRGKLHLTLRGVSLGWNAPNNPTDNWGMKVENGASFVKVENCSINHGVRAFNFGGQDITFQNCRFRYQQSDFSYGGPGVFGFRNLTLKNNVFEPSSYWVISFFGIDSLTFENNAISGQQRVAINTCSGKVRIAGNRFSNALFNGSLVLFNNEGTAAAPIEVHNNFFGGNMPLVLEQALLLDNTHHVEVFHNSFYCKMPNASAACLRLANSSSNVHVQNNLFQTPDYGRSLASDNWGQLATCDYNNHFDLEGTVSNANGDLNDTLTLQAWQTLSGFDLHSTQVQAVFRADVQGYPEADDLHISPDFTTEIRMPNPLPSVPFDVDGMPRSFSQPFAGADEPDVIQNDAAIIAIEPDSIGVCAGTHEIVAQLFNQGNVPLESITIQWKLGSAAQPDFFWTGNLLPGDTAFATLGVIDINETDTLHLAAWTTLPNGATDAFQTFDSVFVQVTAGVSGSFTVGGQSPDFATIQSALDWVAIRGLCGDVTLNLRSGNYDEQLIIPDIRGSNAGHRLLLQSEAMNKDSVSLRALAINHIQVSGRQFLEFKHLTFRWLDFFSPPYIFYFGPVSGQIHFEGNLFFGNGDGHAVEVHTSATPTNISFIGNSFSSLGTALAIYGTDPPVGQSLMLKDNQFYGCVSSVSAAYLNNVEITNNRIDGETTEIGLGLYRIEGSLEVSQNRIYSTIGKGIAVEASQFGNEPGRIFNNIVRNNLNFNVDTVASIYVSGSQNLEIQFNTFSMITEPLFSYAGSTAWFKNSSEVLFRNNIAYSNTSSPALRLQNMGSYVAGYNDYFVPLGTYLLEQDGNGYVSLPIWSSNTGYDAFSNNYDPVFATDSLLFTNPFLQNTGVFVPGIATDFAGKPRSDTPDPGAYESDALALLEVWPGDCNDDGFTDYLDFLSIGFGMGQNMNGPPRTDQGIDWAPKSTTLWQGTVLGANAAHTDTDGNGSVTPLDSIAIAQNYGLMHNFTGQIVKDRNATTLFLSGLPALVSPGQSLSLPLHLGQPGEMATFYGIAFQAYFEGEVGTPSFTFESTWPDLANNAISFSKWLPAEHRLDVAFVKTNALDAVGDGQIATLHLQAGTMVDDSLRIRLVPQRALLFNESTIEIGGTTNALPTLPSGTEVALNAGVIIQPIPADTYLKVSISNLRVKKWAMHNLIGQTVLMGEDFSAGEVDVSMLIPGNYVLAIQLDNGDMIRRQVVIL